MLDSGEMAKFSTVSVPTRYNVGPPPITRVRPVSWDPAKMSYSVSDRAHISTGILWKKMGQP